MKKLILSALILSLSLSVFACSKTEAVADSTSYTPVTTTAAHPRSETPTYNETPDFLLERAGKKFSGNIYEDNHRLRVKSTPEEFKALVESYLGGDFKPVEEAMYGDYYSDEYVLWYQSNDRVEAQCKLVEYESHHAELYFIFYRTEELNSYYRDDDCWSIDYDGDPGYSQELVLDKTGKVAFETNADDVFIAYIMGFNVDEHTIAGSINDSANSTLPALFLSDDGNGGIVDAIDITDPLSEYNVYGLGVGKTVGENLELLTERMLRHGFTITQKEDDKVVYSFLNVSIAFDIREFGTDNQITGIHIYLSEDVVRIPFRGYESEEEVLYDVTGDGIDDACYSAMYGSGMVRLELVVEDQQTGEKYILDGYNYDYFIQGVEDGKLVIIKRGPNGYGEPVILIPGTVEIEEGQLVFVPFEPEQEG